MEMAGSEERLATAFAVDRFVDLPLDAWTRISTMMAALVERELPVVRFI